MDKSRIYLSSPHLGINEENYVKEAFKTNWIAPTGPHIEKFENEICNKLQVKYSTVLSSGTSAIHLALILLGIKPNDIVLCQSFTFVASINPVNYLGAKPVLIDSESETWNIDPKSLRKSINYFLEKNLKPKAIIAVHLYGMPAKINEINSISKEYDIPVIEDAAEALGSQIKNKYCGSFGDLSILSFNGNKIITSGGGGALLSNNKDMIDKAKFLSTQARDKADHYEHSQIGYNYRLSNVLAGVGRAQLELLDKRVIARRNNFEKYKEFFSNKEGITLLNELEGSFSNRWLSTIIIDPSRTSGITSNKIRNKLMEENIESRPLWKPMHLQPLYKKCQYFGSNISENLFKKGVCLPSGSNLSDNDFERIFEVLNKLL